VLPSGCLWEAFGEVAAAESSDQVREYEYPRDIYLDGNAGYSTQMPASQGLRSPPEWLIGSVCFAVQWAPASLSCVGVLGCDILRAMSTISATASSRANTAAFVALVASAAYLVVFLPAGCGLRYPAGSLDDLFVSNKRYVIDKDKGLVHAFARVENTGEGIIREVKMEAVIRSPDGNKRGTNNVILKDIKPGEKRDFSVVITSHSQGHTIEITATEVDK
jgi:hypothetical protein